MIYLFDKDEQLIKNVKKAAVKTALQTYSLTTERYVSDRLTIEMKALSDDELSLVEYMAIQSIEDGHNYHYFYVAQKRSEGKLAELIGVQSGIEELRKTPVYDKRPKNAFAREVVSDLLLGTNWSARFVGETLPRSTNFYYTSVFDALKKVCKVWDLEMQFFVQMNGNQIGARVIDFKQKIGQATGKRVVYGHNALQVLQEVERTNLYTALIGRGKGEQVSSANSETGQAADGYGRKLTFENVVWRVSDGKPVNKPKGQKFVELPGMTALYGIKQADGRMRPKIGFVEFSEEEDPAVLLQRTYDELVNASRPQVTFKTSAVYLKGALVGDTVRVVRHDKRLDYDTRIFELTINRLNNRSSDIKLGDRITESQSSRAQTIADKAVEEFVNNEFSTFVQNLPDYLPSADGFNNNWYGAEDPTVQHKGKVAINDIWYKPDTEHEGHRIMLRWTGEVWEELVRTYDTEAIKRQIESVNAKATGLEQQVQQSTQKAQEALASSGASQQLAQTAQRLAADANARAQEFTRQALEKSEQLTATLNRVDQELGEAKRQLQAQTGQLEGFNQQFQTVEQDLSGTKTSLKNIWVGDRNLLADTEKMGDQTPKRNPNGSLSLMFGRAVKRVDVPANSSDIVEGYRKSLAVALYGDKEIIVSFYAKAHSRGQVIRCQLLDNRNIVKMAETSTGHTNEASDGLVEFPVTNGWLRYWIRYTFKQPCYDAPTVILGSLGGDVSAIERWVEVNSPAVYYGHHNKEWSPSDVDIKTDWANYQQTVNQNLAELGGQIRTTNGSLTELKTSFDQTKEGIKLLASKSELDGVTGRLTNAETTIRQTADGIKLLATKSEVDTVTGRLTTAESSLEQQADQIIQRLTRSEVDSLITEKGYVANTVFDNYKRETADTLEHRLTATKSDILGQTPQVTDFNAVKQTAQLYERILGKTEADVTSNISRQVMTNNLFQTEIKNPLVDATTKVQQLSDSWAVKYLTNSGTVLSQLNLNSGGVKIQGKLIHLNGQTLIDNGVIKNAMIESLAADKMTTGTLNAANVNIINLNANKLVGLDANFIKAKIETALVEWLRGKVISAQNDAMRINLNQANITFNRNATIEFNSAHNALVRKKGTHTAFVHFSDVASTVDGGAGSLYSSIGVTSSGDGVNSASSGRFCGARFFRGAKGTNHLATIDQAEIFGDSVYIRDDFGRWRGYKFDPTRIDKMVDMNYLINAVRALGRCWTHFNNAGWNTADQNLRNSVMQEYNNHIKNL